MLEVSRKGQKSSVSDACHVFFLMHVRRPVFPQVIRDLRVGLRRPGEPSSSHTQAQLRQRMQAYVDDESQVSGRGVENHDSVVHQVHQSHPGHRHWGSLSLTSFCESQQCRPLARRERRYFAGRADLPSGLLSCGVQHRACVLDMDSKNTRLEVCRAKPHNVLHIRLDRWSGCWTAMHALFSC